VAVVYALGEIKEVITEPGLKFKLPPPFQNVVFLDKRIQTLDSPETPADLHRREEEPGDRLAGQVAHRRAAPVHPQQRHRLRNLESPPQPGGAGRVQRGVTKRDVSRRAVGRARQGHAAMCARLADEAKAFGIEIVDVRIKRVDFVADITDSVFAAWSPSASRWPTSCVPPAQAEGEKIRADADRQREVIVAEAYRDAQKIKGDRRRQGVGAVCRCLRPRPAVRAVLSQPGGLPHRLPVAVGRDGARPEQRVLQGDARQLVGRGQVAGRHASGAIMSDLLLGAVALMLVFEGLLPFLSPGAGAGVRARHPPERRPDPLRRPEQHADRRGAAAGVLALNPRCGSAATPGRAQGRYNAVFNPGAHFMSSAWLLPEHIADVLPARRAHRGQLRRACSTAHAATASSWSCRRCSSTWSRCCQRHRP
jgi:hypothetical protein